MKKVKLNIVDERMLELVEILKATGQIRFRQAFCDAIEMPKQNIRNIETGHQRFSLHHVQKACEAFGVNPGWIFGMEDRISFYPPVTIPVSNADTKNVTKKSVQANSNIKSKKLKAAGSKVLPK